jgi:hypothetical protein
MEIRGKNGEIPLNLAGLSHICLLQHATSALDQVQKCKTAQGIQPAARILGDNCPRHDNMSTFLSYITLDYYCQNWPFVSYPDLCRHRSSAPDHIDG